MEVSFTAVEGLPEIQPGEDLGEHIARSLQTGTLVPRERDVLIVAQKAVSKAEGCFVELDDVVPSAQARRLAQITGKDPRFVEVVLRESEEIVRAAPNVLIVRHRRGFVMANAGVDRSNVPATHAARAARARVLLLPRDPDGSAAALRQRLTALLGISLGVIVSDSFGRPWRRGVVNVALGCAGLPALIDRRGALDRNGRKLEVTEVAFADALAAGAGLVMGEAAESTPLVLARGLDWSAPERDAGALLRPRSEDLFR
ncbi:MAG TPA: coenzyme F420-0:L-glutamate ligase [Steroidobacteraceae bacterium]|nr:coenzyme F420-0:L-glutamate ligase [Steroidobacteraceae bacterium]